MDLSKLACRALPGLGFFRYGFPKFFGKPDKSLGNTSKTRKKFKDFHELNG